MARAGNLLLVGGVIAIIVLSSVFILLLPNQQSAFGTFAGENGKIAFRKAIGDWDKGDIYVMNADGSGQTKLTDNAGYRLFPDWSPDGTKIAFARGTLSNSDYDIYVMNADGSGQTKISNSPNSDQYPSWSPDGTKIAFTNGGENEKDIYVMNADGSGQTKFTNDLGDDIDPSWSPDGEKIAFASKRLGNIDYDIYVMNADGSGQTKMTTDSNHDLEPDWSPDGTKIAFTSDTDAKGHYDIYVMNADGGVQTNLTSDGWSLEPSWSPDGEKIIFSTARDHPGAPEIYVMNADGSAQTRLTNNQCCVVNDQPDWGPAIEPLPEPVQTVLTLNTIANVPWGTDVTVTGKLANASSSGGGGEGIGGKTITFDGTGADNLPDNVVTKADGTFTAKGASPNTVATGWTVQAHFAGDSKYSASDSNIQTYSTVKHSVTLVVFLNPPTNSVPWGNPTKFTATLVDASLNGAPIPGKTIHFDGTGVIGVADKTTDSSGKATSTGTAPNSVASGWTYQAHFAGDSLYSKKDSPVMTYSTIKHSVSLVVSAASNSVLWGKPTTFTATLTDASRGGIPLSGKTIHFDGTGVIPASDKTTDSSGKAIATGTAPKKVSPLWTYQAHFAGDSLYDKKDSTTKTYSTTKHATSLSLVVSPSTVAPGGTYKVYGYLKDSSVSGTPPISSRTIVITAESPIIIGSKTTDATGKYIADGLKAPARTGSYDIQSHFYGDSLYSAKDSPTRTLTVTAP